jgi:hypothetical protein
MKLRIADPGPFSAAVEIPTPGGVAQITCTFRHLGVKELSAFVAGAAQDGMPSARKRLFAFLRRVPGLRAWADAKCPPALTPGQRLAQILIAWEGVDEPFSVDAVERMCDLYPMAAGLIVQAWGKAAADARLGN